MVEFVELLSKLWTIHPIVHICQISPRIVIIIFVYTSAVPFINFIYIKLRHPVHPTVFQRLGAKYWCSLDFIWDQDMDMSRLSLGNENPVESRGGLSLPTTPYWDWDWGHWAEIIPHKCTGFSHHLTRNMGFKPAKNCTYETFQLHLWSL